MVWPGHLGYGRSVRYVKLGNTGLDISPIALGCMSFGEPARGYPSWTLPEDQSRPLIKQALEAGVNFFDTANIYSAGSSEEITGRALKDFASRDDVVIATKVRHAMRPAPNGTGLSRKAILAEIDASLTRLGTDYVDLYQIHRLDHSVPMEETLEALHDVVKAGKARYVGACSMYAWEFSKALHLQERHGWARFVSMQDHYNLLNREEEREMLPLCADAKVGVIPWSPLARGRLARAWAEATDRSANDPYARLCSTSRRRATRWWSRRSRPSPRRAGSPARPSPSPGCSASPSSPPPSSARGSPRTSKTPWPRSTSS
jgi:aryl-alcohol dehydrogenase-like predicted oxidoreductase